MPHYARFFPVVVSVIALTFIALLLTTCANTPATPRDASPTSVSGATQPCVSYPRTAVQLKSYTSVTPTPQSQPAPQSAAGLQPPQSSKGGSTGVFFLIDESGGVNGECPGVTSEEVFVVDRDAKTRHAVVRFFLTLMGTTQSREPNKQDLKVGIARFANGYDYALPLTNVSSLLERPEWASLYNSLSNGIFDVKSLDPCFTNYADALRRATNELEGVQEKYLILITDGSFRGSEVGPITSAQYDTTRYNTELALQYAVSRGVKVYAILLGGSQCVEANDCGLGNDDFPRRYNDLKLTWEAWAKRTLVHRLLVLDRDDPFRVLAEDFARFLPPDEIAMWVDASGKGQVPIHRYIRWASVTAVSVDSVFETNMRLLDADERAIGVPSPDSRAPKSVFQWDVRNYPEPPPVDSCGLVTWTLRVPPGDQVYYRLRESIPLFGLTLLVPEPIIMNSPDMTAEVNVGGVTQFDFNSCYQMRFALLTGTKEITSVVRPLSQHISQKLAFQPLSSAQALTLQAQIQLSDVPTRVITGLTIPIWAEYMARLSNVQSKFSSAVSETMKHGDAVTVSFHILYGSPEYVPGFSPVFSLTSRIPGGPGTAVPPGCKDPGLDPRLRYNPPISDTNKKTELIYSVVIPYTSYWGAPKDTPERGDRQCGYRYVDVAWPGFNCRYDISDSPPRLVPISSSATLHPSITLDPSLSPGLPIILLLLLVAVAIVIVASARVRSS